MFGRRRDDEAYVTVWAVDLRVGGGEMKGVIQLLLRGEGGEGAG